MKNIGKLNGGNHERTVIHTQEVKDLLTKVSGLSQRRGQSRG